VQQFERDPMLLLHDVARLMRTRFDQKARMQGMTRAQWIILAWLNRQPGLSQNEMASILEVEPISVGRLIDRLEARGLVERRPDPTDRRVRRLHLMPAANPVIDEIARHREALAAEFLEGVDSDDRSQLVDLLIHIKSNLTADRPIQAAVGE
jgi:MarR family transcriptional regulator, transcriptional regulator for hemolysin